MIPSFNFSINTDSNTGLSLGCKATVEKNGYVASIELNNLLKNVELSVGAGRRLPRGHAVSIRFDATKDRGPSRITAEYFFDSENQPENRFGIRKIGIAYSMGVRDNWGLHGITSGLEGADPYPYSISWNHTHSFDWVKSSETG